MTDSTHSRLEARARDGDETAAAILKGLEQARDGLHEEALATLGPLAAAAEPDVALLIRRNIASCEEAVFDSAAAARTWRGTAA